MILSRKILVVKQFTFDSCHRLVNYVGKCNRMHGHTYKIEVGVYGTRDSRGLVIDFGDLKKLVSENLIDGFASLDHNNLNENMQIIDGSYKGELNNTTCENMVDSIFDFLSPLVAKATDGKARLEMIRLWETPTSYAEIWFKDTIFAEGDER